jgi:hypothetical protein
MGKKSKKIEYSLEPDTYADGPRTFHVINHNDLGSEHDYTIKVTEVESGTLYTMEYSNSKTWSHEQHGVNIFRLLNTGNGYEWVDNDQMSTSLPYDDFQEYSVFFRLIQELEGHYRHTTRILEVSELTSYYY